MLMIVPAGCGSAKLFGAYPELESAGTRAADVPWPLLVDTPEAPPEGNYSDAVPDPATGVAAAARLGVAAHDAAERSAALSQPVLTEAERRRLIRHR